MEMKVLPCLSADSLAFTFTAQHGNKSLSQGCVTSISLRGTTGTNKSNSKHECETDSTRGKKRKAQATHGSLYILYLKVQIRIS